MPKSGNKTSFKARSLADSYTVDSRTGCWEWSGCKSARGYGVKGLGRTSTTAQRWVYEQVVGPIPEGLHIDHLCRNPGCVNPRHLEPVTPLENNRRRPNAYDRNFEKSWVTKRVKGGFSSRFAGVSASGNGWQARVSIGRGKPSLGIGTSPVEEMAAYCLLMYRKEVPLAPL